MLRQSIYSRLAGYEDVNDAEHLCLDPSIRTMVGGRAKNNTAASTSEMARFETEILASKDHLELLIDLSGKWIDQAHRHRKLTKLILDMDSSVSETDGHQEGAAYNGYFACTCYHPLFLFNQFGVVQRVMLRRGNHPNARFLRRVLLPVMERYRDRDIPKYFCGDSAFALPATEAESRRRASAVCSAGRFRGLRGGEEPAAATPGLGQTRSGAHPGGKFVAPDPSPE
jgi:hypothetical protein